MRSGQPARPQVSQCVGLSASDRKYPSSTDRSGTQRARLLRSRMTADSVAPWSSSSPSELRARPAVVHYADTGGPARRLLPFLCYSAQVCQARS